MAASSRRLAQQRLEVKERRLERPATDGAVFDALNTVNTNLTTIEASLTAIEAAINAQGTKVPSRGKFGRVGLLDAADAAADVWDWGSDDLSGTPTKTFPTSSQSFYFSSDSASDTSVTISVRYIDASGDEQTTTVSLNGQTVVDPSLSGFDVDRMIVNGATAAVGNIYCTTENNHTSGTPNDATKVLNTIRAGFGQTQTAGFTVPLAKEAVIKLLIVPISRASGAAGSAVVHLRVREFGKTWVVKRNFYLTTTGSNTFTIAGVTVPARANVMVRVEDVSDNDTNVSCDLGYDLEDE